MEITTAIDGTTTTLAPNGWLDTSTSPNLANALEQVSPDCEQLVFDFSNLEYISSAGLRVIVSAHKKMSGNFKLTNVSPEVMQVLHMAGFDRRIDIE